MILLQIPGFAHIEQGPYTTGSVHVLTSCFDDTILLPIGCWIFIIIALVLFVMMRGRRDRNVGYPSAWLVNELCLCMLMSASDGQNVEMNASSTTAKPLISNARSDRSSRSASSGKSRIILLVLSTFLIIALIAMHALEIARLHTDHQGIGLLPFCFVPLFIVLLSLYIPSPAWSEHGWSRPARPHGVAWMALVSFWTLWMTATVGIKLWSFSRVEHAIGEAKYNGNDTKYPYSDRLVSDRSLDRWVRELNRSRLTIL